jgi:sirohydrochlorin cobaltochelatase
VKQGLLLFAHGARDVRWAQPFEEVLRQVSARSPDVDVRLCYLELMSPSLPVAARQLALAGCERIDVLPMFLGTGGHVRNDLPRLLAELAADHPQVEWHLARPIGEIDSVIEAMSTAATELTRMKN